MPRITYDSKTIDINLANSGLQLAFSQEKNINNSSSGKAETVNKFGIQEVSLEMVFNNSDYDDFVAWWSWARQGLSWSFVMDASKMVSTTLTASAAAGATSLEISDKTGLADGDYCFLKSALDDKFEVIQLSSTGVVYWVDELGNYMVDELGNYLIFSDSNLELVSVTKFSYEVNDILRHWDYWPQVVCLNKAFNPRKNGRWYNHIVKFAELN